MKKFLCNKVSWRTLICGTVVSSILVWWVYVFFAPDYFWIDYTDLTVNNGIVGGASPKVIGDADYKSAILVRWNRTLWQLSKTTEWVPVCTAFGEGVRYPGFINITDVAAFFGNRFCSRKLEAGRYYIEDDVSWNAVITHSIVIESNEFQIEPTNDEHKMVKPPPIRQVHKHPIIPHNLLHKIFPFL